MDVLASLVIDLLIFNSRKQKKNEINVGRRTNDETEDGTGPALSPVPLTFTWCNLRSVCSRRSYLYCPDILHLSVPKTSRKGL